MNGLTDESTAGADGPWTLPGYTHERELGAGGSGRVVLARHEATGSRVAVKYLSAAVGDTSAFRREAELLGALRSPQVARLYEYVEGPRGAAIVMELVDGIALRALLRQEGATSPEAALVVLKGSLLGLAAAHAAGVVHRDYKPENVLVTVDGSSKLVDFGIAVPHGATGKIAGTPVYMAPEQWAGRPASPSADVYAATATFFECLTGAKPYNGTTLAELAAQHTEAPIPDQLAPEPVRSLIRAGLAKTPGERPASAAALVEHLELVAHAGYGAKWEERGRDALAALVALLPLLLLPSGGSAAAGSTALATTVLGGGAADFAPAGNQLAVPRTGLSRRAKVLAGAVGVALLGGAMVDVAVADGPGAWGATRITTAGPAAELTTSLAPAADVAAGARLLPWLRRPLRYRRRPRRPRPARRVPPLPRPRPGPQRLRRRHRRNAAAARLRAAAGRLRPDQLPPRPAGRPLVRRPRPVRGPPRCPPWRRPRRPRPCRRRPRRRRLRCGCSQ